MSCNLNYIPGNGDLYITDLSKYFKRQNLSKEMLAWFVIQISIPDKPVGFTGYEDKILIEYNHFNYRYDLEYLKYTYREIKLKQLGL